jgi:hypothetical protein
MYVYNRIFLQTLHQNIGFKVKLNDYSTCLLNVNYGVGGECVLENEKNPA